MSATPSVARPLRAPAVVTALALGGWAAMMLPSLVPAVSLAACVGRSATGFVGGYVAVWAATRVLAHLAADALAAGAALCVAP